MSNIMKGDIEKGDIEKGDAIHASAVAINGQAVMLCGPSGSGKSTLAMRLIDAHGARLIGDDRLLISAAQDTLCVSPHARLVGLIELRGLGLLRLPYESNVPLALVVQLVARAKVPRLAEADRFRAHGLSVAQLRLHGHDVATPLTITQAIIALADGFRDDATYPAHYSA